MIACLPHSCKMLPERFMSISLNVGKQKVTSLLRIFGTDIGRETHYQELSMLNCISQTGKKSKPPFPQCKDKSMFVLCVFCPLATVFGDISNTPKSVMVFLSVRNGCIFSNTWQITGNCLLNRCHLSFKFIVVTF